MAVTERHKKEDDLSHGQNMESTPCFGEQSRQDGDRGESRPARGRMVGAHGRSGQLPQELVAVRGFVDADPMSLAEFLARVGTVRSQLRALVHMAETADQDTSPGQALVADLRSTYRQFERLQRSPLAWHDVHGGDAELMRRVENLLWQASSQSPSQSRV